MSTDTEPLLKVRGLKIGATVYPPGERPRDIDIVHGVDFSGSAGDSGFLENTDSRVTQVVTSTFQEAWFNTQFGQLVGLFS